MCDRFANRIASSRCWRANRTPADLDPPLYQPGEPGAVRRNPAAARSRARHAQHPRRDRSDAVRLRGRARARHRTLAVGVWSTPRAADRQHADSRRAGSRTDKGDGQPLFVIEGATGHRDAAIWPELSISREAFTAMLVATNA